MINYIRLHTSDPSSIANADTQLWLDDKYLKPVEVDSWLMFGKITNFRFSLNLNEVFLQISRILYIMFRSFPDIDEIKLILAKSNANNTKSQAHIIEDLQRKLNDKDAVIEHLTYQMEQMKNSYRFLIEQTDNNGGSISNNSIADSPLHKQIRLEQAQNVAEVSAEDDEAYFSTYAHFDIHHDMLSVS